MTISTRKQRLKPLTVAAREGDFQHHSCIVRFMSEIEIFKEFRIEAAHRLPNVPAGHKCSRLHGHSFRVVVHVAGPVDPVQGWVCDFADLTEAFTPVFDQLDHRHLNEVAGLENPTSEVLAEWIWQRLRFALPGLTRITIHETCTSGCEYRGPQTPTTA